MELKNFKAMDPNILYSFINARLRVSSPSLEVFCEDQGIDMTELLEHMMAHGFCYNEELHQFR